MAWGGAGSGFGSRGSSISGDEHPQLVDVFWDHRDDVHVTYRRVRRQDVEQGVSSGIGHPLSDLQCYVLAASGLEVLPMGWWGGVVCAGAGLAQGYLNRSGLTASTL